VGLITQNVDRLHQRAGSDRVLDLHGRLDRVSCTGCGHGHSRDSIQTTLLSTNAQLVPSLRRQAEGGGPAPDGDALVSRISKSFRVPECVRCGGVLKPDVVFYGESVPRSVVEQSYRWVTDADGLLFVGSSLMVFSSFRFARAAAESDTPIAILNQGVTRADELATLKLDAACGPVLAGLAERLGKVD